MYKFPIISFLMLKYIYIYTLRPIYSIVLKLVCPHATTRKLGGEMIKKEKKYVRISKLQSQTLTTIILRGILRCRYLLNVCTYIVRNVSHRTTVFPNLFSVTRNLGFREKLPWNRIGNFLVLFINDLC